MEVPATIAAISRPLSVALASFALVAACSAPTPIPSAPSASPGDTTEPTATAPSATAPVPTAQPTSTVAPSAPSPTPSPASPSPAATGCGVQADEGRLPSDRLVDVRVSREPGADVVTFVFGDPSSPSLPLGIASGSIQAVEPPFSAAGSGEPIDVPGEHHVAVRFTGMSLYDDSGRPTYDGPTTFREALPALRAIAQDDAFEGNSGWILGYDGSGCVTLASGPGTVSVRIEHGPG